jgi:DNA polymerase
MNSWEELERLCKNCNKCKLAQGRNNIVIGDGNKNAEIMFIGEGPGVDEDAQGIPFVGKAGKLMNMAFAGIGIKREEVYITNIVKCRPPNNRNLEKDVVHNCMEYLNTQIELVKPKVIVLFGNIALKNILGEEYGISKVRGTWIEKDGIKYLPTFHPAALLCDESKKIAFWQDLKTVNQFFIEK